MAPINNAEGQQSPVCRVLASASLDLMLVQAGLRTLHEAGPEVKRAISGNLEELADVELETNTRRNMPFFGSVIQVGNRITKFEALQSWSAFSRL